MNDYKTTSFIENAFAPLKNTIDTLWSTLAPQHSTDKAARIAFTSTEAGEGATTIAACAAIGLAKHMQADVLLVEANFHNPRLASYMKLPSAPGLAGVLTESADPQRAVQRTDVPRLSVLTAGVEGHIPSGIFSTERTREVFDQLADGYDFLLVDTPPVLAHPETHAVLWQVDDAVLVLHAGRTRRDSAEKAAHEIARGGTHLIGAVLNRHRSDLPSWLTGDKHS